MDYPAKEKEVRLKVSEDKFKLIQEWSAYFDTRPGPFCLHLIMDKILELEAHKNCSITKTIDITDKTDM